MVKARDARCASTVVRCGGGGQAAVTLQRRRGGVRVLCACGVQAMAGARRSAVVLRACEGMRGGR